MRVSSLRKSSHLHSSSSSSSSTSSVFSGHQWSRQSSVDEGVFHSSCNSPAKSIPNSPIGPKFKLIHEGDIHLCRLNHQRTVISKILSSKFLRRWENHRLYLTSVNIASKTVSLLPLLPNNSKELNQLFNETIFGMHFNRKVIDSFFSNNSQKKFINSVKVLWIESIFCQLLQHLSAFRTSNIIYVCRSLTLHSITNE